MYRLTAGEFLFVIFLVLLTIGFGQISFAAPTPIQAIAPGCHAITEEERAALKEAGADIPANGQFCDKDKALLYGSCPESPYAYLESKKTGSNVDVAHLNADYACRLSKFLKAADAVGMNIRIASGYRSIGQQADLYRKYLARGGAPVAPPGRSRHNYGIAVDLHFDGIWPNFHLGNGNTARCLQTLRSCKWAHDNSGTYGLRWPMLVEPWHIEPGTGIKGLEQLPSDPNYWVSDEGTTYGGVPITPAPTPTSGFMNSIRSSLGLSSSPAPITQTPTQNQTQAQQQQAQICNPSFSCTGGTMYYQTTSCTTQVYQVCPFGCDGNSCKVSSSTASTLNNPISNLFSTATTSTTTTKNTNANTNTGTSTIDLINSFGNNLFSSTDVGTATSVSLVLNSNTSDVGQIQDTTANPFGNVASGTITSIQPVNGQQTFTSGDLANSPTSYNPQQLSTFQTILNSMKTVLLWAINYLKPFGGNIPTQTVYAE